MRGAVPPGHRGFGGLPPGVPLPQVLLVLLQAARARQPPTRAAPGPPCFPPYLKVETGSSITWKYPSVVLAGDSSVGEFYSVALTNNMQQVGVGEGGGERRGRGRGRRGAAAERQSNRNGTRRPTQVSGEHGWQRAKGMGVQGHKA